MVGIASNAFVMASLSNPELTLAMKREEKKLEKTEKRIQELEQKHAEEDARKAAQEAGEIEGEYVLRVKTERVVKRSGCVIV